MKTAKNLFLVPLFVASSATLLMLVVGCGSRDAAPQAEASAKADSSRNVTGAPAEDRHFKKSPLAADEAHWKPDDKDAGPDGRADRPSAPAHEIIQSGTLTAGSFDDVARFSEFHKFLSLALQSNQGSRFPQMSLGKQIMLNVRSQQGGAVGNAKIEVFAQDDQAGAATPLRTLTTASDGRAMLLTGLDTRSADKLKLRVTPNDGAPAITQMVDTSRDSVQIILPNSQTPLPAQLDLALVIDTTGSMGDELEYLKVEIDSIAQSIHQMFPNVDQRYALVVYRDDGDEYVTRSFEFTNSLNEFRADLSRQSAAGGGDYPEAMHSALHAAGQLNWRKQNTARVMFLVGDAPPHDQFTERSFDSVQHLRSQGVRVFPIAGSGVKAKAELIMRTAGFLTMGQYLFLTDHSGVGNPHAKPHVPDYQVERLDRLMIRMIASELAGKRLQAKDVLTIERGELNANDGSISFSREPTPSAARSAVSDPFPIPLRWLAFAALVIGALLFDFVERCRLKSAANR